MHATISGCRAVTPDLQVRVRCALLLKIHQNQADWSVSSLEPLLGHPGYKNRMGYPSMHEIREQKVKSKYGHYTTHSGRDTYISICVQRGVNMQNILDWAFNQQDTESLKRRISEWRAFYHIERLNYVYCCRSSMALLGEIPLFDSYIVSLQITINQIRSLMPDNPNKP